MDVDLRFQELGRDFRQPALTFFPRAPNLDAFHSVFVQENIARYLLNSVIIAVPVTLLTLALGSMGAYAMARVRSRLVDVALVVVLLLQVFPEALIATPIFIIFKSMGLLNTFPAVILATTSKTLAFALVILRPMFLQVPSELEEASYVDGCTQFQAFWRIVLPLMRTPLLVVGAICFAQAYGQFVYPITLLNQQHLQPGSVGICRLYRRGIRRLASGDGVRLDLCPAYPRPVPAVAKEYRVGPDCGSAEMMGHAAAS